MPEGSSAEMSREWVGNLFSFASEAVFHSISYISELSCLVTCVMFHSCEVVSGNCSIVVGTSTSAVITKMAVPQRQLVRILGPGVCEKGPTLQTDVPR